ncbi:MAG: pyridoxal-phosphate dependent enzyme [Nannocystaceae bacterium]
MQSHRLALRRGMSDAEYVGLVRALDDRVAEVDGRGFRETPYRRVDAFGAWIKDETGNVAGSHKARHLMGIAIHLEVAERLGLAELRGRDLAIASCGNAALAAAVVARAAGRRLRVFVPPTANPAVLARLEALGAERVICGRAPGDPPGDPCVHRFRAAVDAGVLPFSCQGPDNGLTIQGGLTLALELADQHRRSGAAPLDRLLVQVGGGALASGTIQGLKIAAAIGLLARAPRFTAVQTANAHPLARAVEAARRRARAASIDAAIAALRRRRDEAMIPWPEEPRSVAGGILDDETYDWAVIAAAILETDGALVLADEATLVAARERTLADAGILADATGTAEIAGLLTLRASGAIDRGESIAALVTGARR